MIETLGKLPANLAFVGEYYEKYINKDGYLRNIKNLEYWKLEDVLIEK